MQPQNTNQSEAALHAIDYWQVLKNRYGIIVLTLILVFLTAAVITYVMPKKYESVALIEVKPISDVSPTQSRSEGFGPSMTRQFMNTQFEIIVAPATLDLAIDKAHLEKDWGQDRDTVMKLLRKIIKTSQKRGTDIIEIAVRDKDKAQAQSIAKAVYEAYRDRRDDLENKQRENQLKELGLQLQGKKDQVAELNKRLLDIAEKVQIVVDLNQGGRAITGPEKLIEIAQLEQYKVERQRDEIKNHIKKLLSVEDDKLISVVAELPDIGFREAYEKYEQAKATLKMSEASGLGKNHPEIKMHTASVAELKSNLEKRALNVRESLQHQLQLVEKRVEQMEKVVQAEQDEGTSHAREIQEYRVVYDDYLAAKKTRDEMQQKYEDEKAKASLPRTSIIVHQEPRISKDYVSPNVKINLALGAVVGLIFGVGIAFCLEYLDTSVKSLEDVERFLKVPVLAVVPKDVGVLHKQSGMSPDAEAYRILRTNIEFNRKNPEDNAITVVSGGAGEGKSTTLVNLAYICAQGGYTTLMIDADLRRPRLHTFFDINNSVGLTNYLTTDLVLEDVILQTPVDNLYFMPSGILPADAAGILNSRRMSELIQDVKQRFDLVLIDSPPILGVSDASVLASEVDLTMIVVQHRKLPRNMLIRVKQAVENVGGHVIGVVLNNVDVRSDSQYQYYTSYYTYYAPTAGDDNHSENQKMTTPTKDNAKYARNNEDAQNDEDLY